MELREVFDLKPEYEGEIHPYALDRYREWLADIEREVQPEKLDYGDLNTYLSDQDKTTLHNAIAQIAEWLASCIGLGEGYSSIPYSLSVLLPMLEIKSLLKKVGEQKEEERRRVAACKELNPPLQVAKKWLNPDEYKEFEKSIAGAVSAYLEHGKEYILDTRSLDYLLYLSKIEGRQEERRRKRKAESKSSDFNLSLNKEISRLKSVLLPQKRKPKEYFEKRANDQRYLGYSFAHLLPADEKQRCDAIINETTQRIISAQFREFLDIRYQTTYFLLPVAEYRLVDIPCLDFSFEIFAVAEIEVWIKPGKLTVDGYTFDLPWIENRTEYGPYFVKLKAPEFLGYQYLLLTSAELGTIFWQNVPLVLILSLLDDEAEPARMLVVAASESYITYKIDSTEEEITIPTGFANYLREIHTLDQMTHIGILGEKVTSIAKKRLNESLTKQKIPLLPSEATASFKDDEFISSLTNLGLRRKDAEILLGHVPRNQTLAEATKLALQKYQGIIAQGSYGKTFD